MKHPDKSIPIGTLIAITISAVMYFSFMGLWGAVATRDYLIDGASSSSHSSFQLPPPPMGNGRVDGAKNFLHEEAKIILDKKQLEMQAA